LKFERASQAEQFVVRNSKRNSPRNETRNEGRNETISFRCSCPIRCFGVLGNETRNETRNFCRAERCVCRAKRCDDVTKPSKTSDKCPARPRSTSVRCQACRAMSDVSSDRQLRNTMRAGTRWPCRVLRRSCGILGPLRGIISSAHMTVFAVVQVAPGLRNRPARSEAPACSISWNQSRTDTSLR